MEAIIIMHYRLRDRSAVECDVTPTERGWKRLLTTAVVWVNSTSFPAPETNLSRMASFISKSM